MTHQAYELKHHQKCKIKHARNHILRNFFDIGIYVVSVLGPLLTIPQVTKIWFNQTAEGVSVIAWSGFLVAAIFWLFYGMVHKEKPIIITNCLWIVLELFVVIGALKYG